jgi:hypothetical protein
MITGLCKVYWWWRRRRAAQRAAALGYVAVHTKYFREHR